MGGNTSLPTFNPDATEYDIHGVYIGQIPDTIPPNKFSTVNLQHTGLIEPNFPKSMPHLKVLNLSYNKIQTLTPAMARSLKGYVKLDMLDFSENQITSVPKDFSLVSQVTILNFFANKITEFNYSNKHLQQLNLGHNSLTQIPTLDSKDLQSFVFDWNTLITLDFKMVSLTHLSLVCVGLEKISPSFNFPNLEILDIRMNRLMSVPNFEQTTPKLRILDMSHNFITDFPIVPKTIENLSINHNSIKEIPYSLPLLENLKVFGFSNNLINFVPMVPNNIKKIYGSSNRITHFSASNTPYLTDCILADNYLETMPQIVRNQIISYHMNHNKIKTIQLDYISRNVTIIELVDNQIHEIPCELFQLPSLERLSLMHNTITEIPGDIVKAKKLTTLNLSFNIIKQIPLLPTNLTEFHIASNQLTEIPHTISQSKIALLDVCLNCLTKLPPLPNVIHLYASQNNIATFPELNPNIQSIDLSFNSLQQVPSLPFSLLNDFDISHNQIRGVPDFSKCPKIAIIKLADNPMNGVLNTICKGAAVHQIDFCNTTQITIDSPSAKIREVLLTKQSGPPLNMSRAKYLSMGNSSYVSEMKGVRDAQEDSILLFTRTVHGHSVYAVFDGHGGGTTSLLCTIFMKKFVNGSQFEFTDSHLRQGIRKLQNYLETKNIRDGSTMAFAMINQNKVMIAHIGDARVLVTNDKGNLHFATPDHKPSTRSEFERIHNSGGRVTNGRVNSILAVARSLGDLSIAQSLSAEPDITMYTLKEDDKWLIVACDGVFDVLSNDYLAKIGGEINDPDLLAYTIRNTAFSTNSYDNITSIAVNLHKRAVDPILINPS